MRLIHCRSLQLEEFLTSDLPAYAILSHTWASDEVSFASFTSDLAAAKLKTGFRKIDFTCKQAIADGLEYAWVDTSCIDKSSSAELSEAINSMFNWYKKASVCYAYLSDVTKESFAEEFLKSRWFQRGWTLQELIAPTKVIFFDSAWNGLGSKQDHARLIHNHTKIDETVLRTSVPSYALQCCSIAKRMAWASQRTTTRVEDMAYCLLGMFNVNMPLLYGEGNKAFHRLQKEIIKVADDDSIFAWGRTTNAFSFDTVKGMMSKMIGTPVFDRLFAESPKDFANCHDVISSVNSITPYTITNQGLSMELPLMDLVPREESFLYAEGHYAVGILTCKISTEPTLLGILLAESDHTHNLMHRVKMDAGTFGDPSYAATLLVGPRLAAEAVSKRVTILNPMDVVPSRDSRKRYDQILVNQTQVLQSLKYTVTFKNKCLYRVRKGVKHHPAIWEPRTSVITIERSRRIDSMICLAFKADGENGQDNGFSVLVRGDNAIVCKGSSLSLRKQEKIYTSLKRRSQDADETDNIVIVTENGRQWIPLVTLSEIRRVHEWHISHIDVDIMDVTDVVATDFSAERRRRGRLNVNRKYWPKRIAHTDDYEFPDQGGG
ncbi:heterokaryon incompatibility protein-domain-containing protein [Paraphoma chrysanthemicola]|uniref:Heterokaryon incompatibility protein-domain-containing protein n=1 Tax=Paraphoma chrysanthemicola TaxID=798071 RepID=A0A8K0VZI8_9PLEO|nr:heterokaryon incompatibility protein-domain-containing protein [Paraphoma chrysanthemicola]